DAVWRGGGLRLLAPALERDQAAATRVPRRGCGSARGGRGPRLRAAADTRLGLWDTAVPAVGPGVRRAQAFDRPGSNLADAGGRRYRTAGRRARAPRAGG